MAGVQVSAQTPRTAVLYILGQSNSSNHGGQKYQGMDDRVVNYFDGACYRAASPLLGAEGTFGEAWTLLGNKLVAGGKFDQVIIVPSGIGLTGIAYWARGGRRFSLRWFPHSYCCSDGFRLERSPPRCRSPDSWSCFSASGLRRTQSRFDRAHPRPRHAGLRQGSFINTGTAAFFGGRRSFSKYRSASRQDRGNLKRLANVVVLTADKTDGCRR